MSQEETEERKQGVQRGYIKGEILHVVFRNEENYYTVAVVRVRETNEEIDEKKLTIVGVLPHVEPDETFLFFGSVADHPKFGIQYKVEQSRRDLPQSKQGVIRYLASDRFPGIGTKTAETIVEKLGETAISRIVENRDVLNDIPGLKEEKAAVLYENLYEQQGVEQVLIVLSEHGFGVELALKVYQVYKTTALEIIKSNPYQLIHDVDGIGFRRADQLGASIGLTGNHPDRLRAGCLYLVHELCIQEGHMYIETDPLTNQAVSLLSSPGQPIQHEEIKQQLVRMHEEGMLVVEDTRVYTKSLFGAEKGIASNIRRLLSTEVKDEFPEAEFLKSLGELEEEWGIEYAPSQKQGIQEAIAKPVMLLTGGPGTGKTTVIRGIVEVYARLHGLSLDPRAYTSSNPFPILLTAPTGRAAKRMSEATGLPSSTIHSMLGWKGGAGGFDKGEHEPLNGELLIIDEMSMVDSWVANSLFKAIPKGMQVVIVGDENQLPSVGPGQVLRDLINSGTIPLVALTDIYRQAEGSSIIELAHAMKDGQMPPDLSQAQSDRRFFPCKIDQVKEVVWQICENAIKKGYEARDIQVLAPMYKGSAGITELNVMLQNLFNPKKEKVRELAFGDLVYRTGDVVLQLVNNPEERVYNGDRGEIVAIFYAKENTERKDQLVVSFDGTEVTYSKTELNQLTHAYCCSIHKAQGSEFPIVVLPVVRSYSRMLRRNLLYTAVTRAKQFLLMCGELRTIEYTITSGEDLERQSQLVTRLQLLINEDAKP
ncbi:SF1B family DNA helicase RecD2 [Alkalicoccobacillus murimartini]|uniref:ATP-dependent RecD2 DNA helicase n=1 Tax=Alkalicoccobacillus murimartini TaxID=171685 RepID=A0ABT9YC53_9BACI|nr:ATP-dependent RecD-like DNA helicase [Alkalicoccobacillus murimartini]MDQ0205431.1 exodeoxyribonuclease V alpha subunit [Alkalicoccobacillus murimartini]